MWVISQETKKLSERGQSAEKEEEFVSVPPVPQTDDIHDIIKEKGVCIHKYIHVSYCTFHCLTCNMSFYLKCQYDFLWLCTGASFRPLVQTAVVERQAEENTEGDS